MILWTALLISMKMLKNEAADMIEEGKGKLKSAKSKAKQSYS